MMSEQVWVQVEADKLGRGWTPKTSEYFTIPCNIESDSTTILNKSNDKLINYTFSLDAAHDWINNVR